MKIKLTSLAVIIVFLIFVWNENKGHVPLDQVGKVLPLGNNLALLMIGSNIDDPNSYDIVSYESYTLNRIKESIAIVKNMDFKDKGILYKL